MTAAEIHAAGLSQVARIEARYQADVMDPLGHPGSFAEFVEKVCKDPTGGQYYQTREALLADYRTLCDQIYDVLPRYFETIPDAKLEIVEKHSETAPAAYYMQGTADGARPGRFYVCGKPSTLVWGAGFLAHFSCILFQHPTPLCDAVYSGVCGHRALILLLCDPVLRHICVVPPPARFRNVSNLPQRPKYEMCALALHEVRMTRPCMSRRANFGGIVLDPFRTAR